MLEGSEFVLYHITPKRMDAYQSHLEPAVM